ncbi:MAG: PAS domain S-box protein [Nitrospira sp.]|nr:PAS domain S-box protein [Nitrospira sp.]HNP28649.1 PAS domain S-box protein [Nitrospirales bacterium]
MLDKNPQRFLIIDDDPDDVELASEALWQRWPDSIIEGVGTAEAGLEKVRASCWSLILLDYKLPGKSGLEVLKELKLLSPETSIILLTGHGDEATAVQVMLAGADYYHRKSTDFLIDLPVVVGDVLEKRHLRLMVKHTDERYHRLIANITDIVFELDAGGCFQYVSPAVYPILGYTPEDMKGFPVSYYLHPEDLSRYAHWFKEEGMKSPGPAEFNARFMSKAGEAREIEMNATVIYDQHNQISDIVGIARDVTERKKAEASLARLHYQYELLLNSVHDGIFGIDLEGKATLVNPAAAHMLGYTRGELQGKATHPIFHHHKVDGAPFPVEDCIIYQAFRDGKVHHVSEDVFWKKDGTHFWVEYTSNPIRENGSIVGAVATFRDITERKKSEERLKKSHEQLRDLAAHLQTVREEERTLVAREIHDEMGSALTCLKMDLAWMAKRIPSTDTSVAPQLSSKMRSMSKLLDGMVQLVQKIATELRPAVLDELGLGPAIEWQAKELRSRTGVTCALDIHPESLVVSGDRATTIFRILQEILTNVTRHANATRISIQMRRSGGYLELKVADNGRGITPLQISSPKSLGLVGMRERALLWGGEMSIIGDPEKGTTAILRLPLNPET